ncbi:MAG: flagellar motor protein MotB [Clostridia bacterium]|nr:flagellar motor protein MotB [Clostridia bacterium]
MGKPKEKIIKDNAERWLLTYADLMNLLLIFFIILYAISQVDQQKYEQLAQSLSNAFGTNTGSTVRPVNPGGGNSFVPMPSNKPSSVISSNMEEEQMDAVKEKVTKLAKDGGLEGKIDVKMEERGIVISITAQLLFKPGSADIEAGSKPTIQEIGIILKNISGNNIRVEGHTDSDPLSNNSKYIDNLELSTARANNVLRLLVKNAGINAGNISSAGYGEQRPVVPNTNAANKAKNRRVNIVILKNVFDKTEPGKLGEQDANKEAQNGTEQSEAGHEGNEGHGQESESAH